MVKKDMATRFLQRTYISLCKSRYAVLFYFILFFVLLSAIVRTGLLFISFHKAGLTIPALVLIYCKGFLFDTATAVFLSVPYSVYLLLLPQELNRSFANKVVTYALFFLVLFIILLCFVAEYTFWFEFESRFNFIAVDYLVYTFEVINNIRQSYPLPLILSVVVLATALSLFIFYKQRIFQTSFQSATPYKKRLLLTGSLLLCAWLGSLLSNSWAETRANRYQNELSKDGIFSFFAAFKSNELSYPDFYKTIDPEKAYQKVREELAEPGAVFISNRGIRRQFINSGLPVKPNVIQVTIESLSADFLEHFGNTKKLMPSLDRLAEQGILFSEMYATGTRTVRGLEALTLSIPPTPGNSLIRKPDNNNLFSTGTVFRQSGYTTSFFYGGNGYFDNMNNFFGNNGFDITDRQGRLIPHESIASRHNFISGADVHFENAWGVCDEDLYDAVIRGADSQYRQGKPFYDFVMTTSNHRPFTYPAGKINIPSGTGRDGAVKYTDYAIGRFLEQARSRPWFTNTVFIFVADHCASSAGKDAIDVGKYHIPCIIYNLQQTPFTINKQCSQIDLFPTLFGLLRWTYASNFYGKNVLTPSYRPRALVGTYQQLGYLNSDSLVILNPGKKAAAFTWNKTTDEQHEAGMDTSFLNKAIADYQTAYSLYKTGGLKLHQ